MPMQSTSAAAAVRAFRPGNNRARLLGTGAYSVYFKNFDGWLVGDNAAGAGFYWAAKRLTNGKWYWEYIIGSVGNDNNYIGVTDSPGTVAQDGGNGNAPKINAGFYTAGNDGWIGSTWGVFGNTGGTSLGNGDVAGIALDLDSNPKTLRMYKNGVLNRSISWTVAKVVYPMFCVYAAGQICFGPGINYSPPVGYTVYK